jgi:hypothetical protein
MNNKNQIVLSGVQVTFSEKVKNALEICNHQFSLKPFLG